MSRPTPPPWKRGGGIYYDTILDADDGWTAQLSGGYGQPVEANTDLMIAACNAAQEANPENPIAAARARPSLLGACEEAVLALEEVHATIAGPCAEAYLRLRAAIDQAREGETRQEHA